MFTWAFLLMVVFVSAAHGSSQCTARHECLKTCTIIRPGYLSARSLSPDTSSPLCTLSQVCCQITKQEVNERCGTGKSPSGKLTPRILGGGWSQGQIDSAVKLGEFPWHGALLERRGTGLYYRGAVSLVDSNVAMTVAHKVCDKNHGELVVRFNDIDLKNKDPYNCHVDVGVEEIVIHEQYQLGKFTNDIALLKLNAHLPTNRNIKSVCLPPSFGDASQERERQEFFQMLDTRNCSVAGWGADNFLSPTMQQQLRAVTVDLVEIAPCRNTLSKYIPPQSLHLDNTNICAGGQAGIDACTGDGGAALVCRLIGTEAFVQIGIVSAGFGCGHNGIPGVYSDVNTLAPWIYEKVERMNRIG